MSQDYKCGKIFFVHFSLPTSVLAELLSWVTRNRRDGKSRPRVSSRENPRRLEQHLVGEKMRSTDESCARSSSRAKRSEFIRYSANSGRVSLTEFRVVFPVCSATKMAWRWYPFLSCPLWSFSFSLLASAPPVVLARFSRRSFPYPASLPCPATPGRKWRAESLGRPRPRVLSLSLYSSLLFAFLSTADHRGPLSPTSRDRRPPSVFYLSRNVADGIADPFRQTRSENENGSKGKAQSNEESFAVKLRDA